MKPGPLARSGTQKPWALAEDFLIMMGMAGSIYCWSTGASGPGSARSQSPPCLYRNQAMAPFWDVTHQSGLDATIWYGGMVAADYDNNGTQDL
jgi:hypothetical protein